MAPAVDHLEIERKYDATDTEFDLVALPDSAFMSSASGRSSLGRLGGAMLTELDATYYDTSDLRLLAQRITLRRRTGGQDAGWHLKLPVSVDERRELSRPLGPEDAAVPGELLDQVRVYVRGQALVAVAELRTTRLERHLLADNGIDLAVLAHDRVRSRRLVGGVTVEAEWSEVEVELTRGPVEVLDLVERVLCESGLESSTWPSKLARALGDLAPEAPMRSAGRGRTATTAAVLVDYLGTQVERLLALDAGARADAPDAVHQLRVATRRLRSQLATYGPVLDRTRTDPIRDELRWLGAVLGECRDAEVLRDRVLASVGRLPADEVIGPVRARVEAEFGARHALAHASLRAALASERYARLLDRLDALVDEPPLAGRAARRARAGVPVLVDAAARRVDRAAARVVTLDQEEALHLVRKAAKRARYAAESAVPVSGRQAERLAARMEALQDVLGEHQDAVMAGRLLPSLAAAAAAAAGENGFTYGVLYGVEAARARAATEAYPAALRAAQRPKVRDWCR